MNKSSVFLLVGRILENVKCHLRIHVLTFRNRDEVKTLTKNVSFKDLKLVTYAIYANNYSHFVTNNTNLLKCHKNHEHLYDFFMNAE